MTVFVISKYSFVMSNGMWNADVTSYSIDSCYILWRQSTDSVFEVTLIWRQSLIHVTWDQYVKILMYTKRSIMSDDVLWRHSNTMTSEHIWHSLFLYFLFCKIVCKNAVKNVIHMLKFFQESILQAIQKVFYSNNYMLALNRASYSRVPVCVQWHSKRYWYKPRIEVF